VPHLANKVSSGLKALWCRVAQCANSPSSLYFHVPRDFLSVIISSPSSSKCSKSVPKRMHTNLLGNPSYFTGLFDCPLHATLGITTIKITAHLGVVR
jgi:hypothetical protein